MQSRGFGYEVKSSILKKVFDSGGELQQLLLRFNQALLLQAEQLVTTYRHTIEQQWCGLSADEHGSVTKPVRDMTQEFAAQMLGIRREECNRDHFGSAERLETVGAIL
jgi:hypothetical protein